MIGWSRFLFRKVKWKNMCFSDHISQNDNFVANTWCFLKTAVDILIFSNVDLVAQFEPPTKDTGTAWKPPFNAKISGSKGQLHMLCDIKSTSTTYFLAYTLMHFNYTSSNSLINSLWWHCCITFLTFTHPSKSSNLIKSQLLAVIFFGWLLGSTFFATLLRRLDLSSRRLVLTTTRWTGIKLTSSLARGLRDRWRLDCRSL